jgi:protein phosphatase
VFLLTSDGLSDFDRVEDYWETEILPILKAEADIASVAEKLVEIANTKNGHDNVTIALVHCQVKYTESESSLTAVIPESSLPTNITEPSPTTAQGTSFGNPNGKTKVIPEEYKQRSSIAQLPLQFIVPLILVAVVGGIGYGVMQWREGKIRFASTTSPTPSLQPTPNKLPKERSLNNLAAGWVIQANSEIVREQSQEKFSKGTFFQVIDKKPLPKSANQDFLVNLRVCPNNQDTSDTAKDGAPASQEPEKIITIKLSELKRSQIKSGVTVLQVGEPNTCVPALLGPDNQPPTPTPQAEGDAT